MPEMTDTLRILVIVAVTLGGVLIHEMVTKAPRRSIVVSVITFAISLLCILFYVMAK